MDEINLDGVDWASVGFVGEPGHRIFMIQGCKQNQTISVIVEKEQVEMFSNQSLEFLDSIKQEYPEDNVATPYDFEKAGNIESVEPVFRAHSLGLVFDPDSKLITLELRDHLEDGEHDGYVMGEITPFDYQENKVIRLTMTRAQLRAMAVRGSESIQAGREICPLCNNPIDITGHLCPRLN